MRDAKRTQGHVTVTDMGARRRGFSTRNTFVGAIGSRPPLSFPFVAGTGTGGWTADGDLYYVDCDHLLLTRDFIVNYYRTDTGDDVLPDKVNRDINGDLKTMRVWFGAPVAMTVVIL